MKVSQEKNVPHWFLSPSDLVGDEADWDPATHIDRIHGRSRSMDDILYNGLRKRLASVQPQAIYMNEKHINQLCVELLRNPDKYGVDLHALVADIFQESILDSLDKNLTCISNYRDCAEGHNVILYKGKDTPHVTRCSHQKYTNTNAIEEFVRYMEQYHPFQEIKDFESLKTQIEEEYNKVKNSYFSSKSKSDSNEKWNVGDLFFYDMALRLVWHHPDRERFMPQRVHIYRGPLFGAWVLWSIKKILFECEGRDKNAEVVKQWDGLNEMPEYGTVEVSQLPPALRLMEPYQIENYLCDYYHFYHRLEAILRRENGLVSRDKRSNPKRTFKKQKKG